MSYHLDMHKKAEEEQKIARREMEESNRRRMEELAKARPSPSPDEVRKATGVVDQPVSVPEEASEKEHKSMPPVVEVEKVSEPKPSPAKGGYSTRVMKAKEQAEK